MNLGDFCIGADFDHSGKHYRCIDIGVYRVIGCLVDDIKKFGNSAQQHIFDEETMKACCVLITNNSSERVYKNVPAMKLSPHWDLSQERVFIENLLNQRFNFMMVFFSLVIAGAINARSIPFASSGIAALGYWICRLLAKAVARAQEKLDAILFELSKDYMHPVAFTDREAKSTVSQRKLIGYRIPKIAYNNLLAVSAVFATVSFYQLWNDNDLKVTIEGIISFITRNYVK
ncbi:hypothetical protein GOFOIKOB_3015 [Methylobacterium tardum]|uniref:Uncharacterized protein n=1 Tax=Methylobacterium tardum TaxID=374432 RepID=A0AA37WRE7_9HYPH|nr:hypothetical protein [Methylobacterium tardum]URD38359.1 hypothetical protein M6G65_07915 [Methylobacterium tardum]GJE49974.1 hypothetical protein GOFOIKOB_3015 [Methylobacterium tardum]GLS70181.1 hypothetical protein GCM10007890_21940 [Methylobacterium tardum]